MFKAKHACVDRDRPVGAAIADAIAKTMRTMVVAMLGKGAPKDVPRLLGVGGDVA